MSLRNSSFPLQVLHAFLSSQCTLSWWLGIGLGKSSFGGMPLFVSITKDLFQQTAFLDLIFAQWLQVAFVPRRFFL